MDKKFLAQMYVPYNNYCNEFNDDIHQYNDVNRLVSCFISYVTITYILFLNDNASPTFLMYNEFVRQFLSFFLLPFHA